MSNKRVGYLRLSEDDNCNFESMSIENQRRIITQYANENGYDYAQVTAVEFSSSILSVGVSAFEDNKALLENDPGYLANLAMLPESQKKALLYGDWDSYDGQVFTEFRNNPDGYVSKLNTHVIEPFKIPGHWRRYRAYDFGYSKPYAVEWLAADHEGRVYVIAELYGCTSNPDTEIKSSSFNITSSPNSIFLPFSLFIP